MYHTDSSEIKKSRPPVQSIAWRISPDKKNGPLQNLKTISGFMLLGMKDFRESQNKKKLKLKSSPFTSVVDNF